MNTPYKVHPVTAALPLHDAAATRGIERAAAAALPPHTLMHRAGDAVARLVLALAPHADRCWIAAGPGNNGGDGLEVAAVLARAGKTVSVSLLADAADLPADAADALVRAQAAGVAIDASTQAPMDSECAVDALLGAGASRAPQGRLAEAIDALNRLTTAGRVVLAVDLPSGLDATTGQPFGDACVTATATLGLLTLKPGLWTGSGRDHAGEIWLDRLGVDPSALGGPIDGTAGDSATDASGRQPRAWLIGAPHLAGRRLYAQHKGSFGDVAIVGGATGTYGAALLAARAAHAAGAGRTYLALLDRSTDAQRLDPLWPELMFRDDWLHGNAAALARGTVVCGCGGGEAVRAPLPRLLSAATRLVLDADALNAIATDSTLAALLHARAARGRPSVITPHPLEAARLLDVSTAEVQRDRLAAAEALAARFRCVAVLKGSGTVIAAPGRTPRLCSTGNAALATAGTGDVLAGWLGGRWTQRPAGADGDDEAAIALQTAQTAVAEHGAAAEPPPPGALLASGLIERLRRR